MDADYAAMEANLSSFPYRGNGPSDRSFSEDEELERQRIEASLAKLQSKLVLDPEKADEIQYRAHQAKMKKKARPFRVPGAVPLAPTEKISDQVSEVGSVASESKVYKAEIRLKAAKSRPRRNSDEDGSRLSHTLEFPAKVYEYNSRDAPEFTYSDGITTKLSKTPVIPQRPYGSVRRSRSKPHARPTLKGFGFGSNSGSRSHGNSPVKQPSSRRSRTPDAHRANRGNSSKPVNKKENVNRNTPASKDKAKPTPAKPAAMDANQKIFKGKKIHVDDSVIQMEKNKAAGNGMGYSTVGHAPAPRPKLVIPDGAQAVMVKQMTTTHPNPGKVEIRQAPILLHKRRTSSEEN